METLQTNKNGQFTVKFGNDELVIKATSEFRTTCAMATAGYRPGALKELLRVASLYNYYDAIGNDTKAGAILVNNRADHVESMEQIANGLLKLEDYKKHYNKVRKQHDKIRVQRGKEKFANMLSNACIG